MSTFGFTVRTWRETEPMQQKVLAAKVGISPQYLCDIEQDKRNPPSDEVIERLAVILDCPTDYLYYRANRLPPDLRGHDVLVSTIMVGWERFRSEIAEEESINT